MPKNYNKKYTNIDHNNMDYKLFYKKFNDFSNDRPFTTKECISFVGYCAILVGSSYICSVCIPEWLEEGDVPFSVFPAIVMTFGGWGVFDHIMSKF